MSNPLTNRRLKAIHYKERSIKLASSEWPVEHARKDRVSISTKTILLHLIIDASNGDPWDFWKDASLPRSWRLKILGKTLKFVKRLQELHLYSHCDFFTNDTILPCISQFLK